MRGDENPDGDEPSRTGAEPSRPASVARRALRVVLWVVLLAVVVVVLFTWVFPWVESIQQDPTLGTAHPGRSPR